MTCILPYERDPREQPNYVIPTLGPHIDLNAARLANLERKIARMEYLLRQAGILVDLETP